MIRIARLPIHYLKKFSIQLIMSFQNEKRNVNVINTETIADVITGCSVANDFLLSGSLS